MKNLYRITIDLTWGPGREEKPDSIFFSINFFFFFGFFQILTPDNRLQIATKDQQHKKRLFRAFCRSRHPTTVSTAQKSAKKKFCQDQTTHHQTIFVLKGVILDQKIKKNAKKPRSNIKENKRPNQKKQNRKCRIIHHPFASMTLVDKVFSKPKNLFDAPFNTPLQRFLTYFDTPLQPFRCAPPTFFKY